MQPKSPFLIFQNFISPLACENMILSLNTTTPDYDPQGRGIPSIRHNQKSEQIVFERTQEALPLIESHYDIKYRAFERPTFEWYVENIDEKWRCGNSEHVRNKWVRVRDRDLTGILFLMDHQDSVPFDVDFEVCGGKLEFAQHGFGFNPERGTLIVFPSGPHFLHRTAPIMAGDLFQVRFHIAAQAPFLYQPTEFPGTYASSGSCSGASSFITRFPTCSQASKVGCLGPHDAC